MPKKAPRSVKAAQALKKESAELVHIHSVRQESSDAASLQHHSRESSDIIASQALRKTEVKIETQPNGSEVTTTIMEIADQVFVFYYMALYKYGDAKNVNILVETYSSNIITQRCFAIRLRL